MLDRAVALMGAADDDRDESSPVLPASVRPCKRGHTGGRYRSGACKTCMRENTRRWIKDNPERMQFLRDRRSGIPQADRPKPEACELCERANCRLVRDHDHASGKFRGWLCYGCNSGLGKLGDSVSGLYRAISYLERSHAGRD